jgi:Holliday junction resolvase RusA-like endonuclease
MVDPPINLYEWVRLLDDSQSKPPEGTGPQRHELKIVYEILPPSSNRIYFKGRILRREAREYAERFSDHCRQHLPEIMQLDPEAIFHVDLVFYLQLLNESYGNLKVPPSKRAKTRYKKIDLDNRVKLLVDCVRDAIGIDDSRIFSYRQAKIHDPARQRVEITIFTADPAQYGIPPVFTLV